MTASLAAVCFDANDPSRVAEFWACLLGRDQGDATLLPPDDTGSPVRFVASDEPKTVKNQMHFDLASTSLEDQQRTVAKAIQWGARHIDVGQGVDQPHVVLADPEGNEFCVLEPDNGFIRGCGFLGCVACDGSQAVGYFWAEALGWPLVWDRDQETAIQSPRGGSKISWGGPPYDLLTGRRRVHFDLAPDGDQQAEVERLLGLGATRSALLPHDEAAVVLADPDGNQFCVRVPSP